MSPRISDEELNGWADRRADDAGRLARELRDARSALTAARSENEALRKAAKALIHAWSNAPDLPEEMEVALSQFEDAMARPLLSAPVEVDG